MNPKYKESNLKIKLGNVVSFNQVENQYKKVGYKNITMEGVQDTTNEINDFCFKRGKSWDFWTFMQPVPEDGVTYVNFNSSGDTLSYSIN
jgi:hypothetical protein